MRLPLAALLLGIAGCGALVLASTLGRPGPPASIPASLERGSARPSGKSGAQERSPQAGAAIARAAAVGVEQERSQDAERERARLLAGARRALWGRVLDDREKGIEGALLKVPIGRHIVEFSSGAGGRYELCLPPMPGVSLMALARGHLSARYNELPFGEKKDLILDRATSLSGRVVDESSGAPIEGASVRLLRLAGHPELRRFSAPVTTDSRGRFLIEDLAPGDFELRAEASGWAVRAVPALSLRPALEPDVEVALVRGATVALEIRSREDHEPLAGAQVRLRSAARAGPALLRLEARSDDQGRVRFEHVPAGELMVIASHPQRAPGGKRLELNPDEGTLQATLELGRGATLSGVTRHRDGTVVAGALVVVVGSSKRPTHLFAQAPAEDDRPRSDERGRFTLTGLRPGRVRVAARDEEFAFGVSKPIDLRKPLQAQEVVVILEPPGLIRGRVVDRRGEPVAGAQLQPHLDRGEEFPQGDLRSDQDGRFTLAPLPLLAMKLEVSAAGHIPRTVAVRPSPSGAEPTEVRIVLTPSSGIGGVLTDQLGRAIPRAQVILREVLPPSPPGKKTRRRPAEIHQRTDWRGGFSLPAVPAGLFEIFVRAWGFHPRPFNRTQAVVPGDDFLALSVEPIEMPQPAQISGIVRSSEDGLPPPKYRVNGRGLRGGLVKHESGGRFTWYGINPGRGELRIEAPGLCDYRLEKVLLGPGERLDLGVIVLRPGGSIIVRCSLAGAKRVPSHLRLSAQARPWPAGEKKSRESIDSARGNGSRLVMTGLPRGRYEVLVRGSHSLVGRAVVQLNGSHAVARVRLLTRAQQRALSAREKLEKKRRKEARVRGKKKTRTKGGAGKKGSRKGGKGARRSARGGKGSR